jgi:hypothetical protein
MNKTRGKDIQTPCYACLYCPHDAWVAAEYLRRCKVGTLKKENTLEAVKCWNLEWILDAEQRGHFMLEELTMDDLVNEDNKHSN